MFEKIFRTYFGIFTFIFLFSASYFMAQTTSNMVRYLFPPPTPFVQPHTSINENNLSKLRAQYAILNKSNLFDPKQAMVVPQQVVAKPKVAKKPIKPHKKHRYCDPDGDYSHPSKLPLELRVTSITSDPNYSLAVIFDARRNRLFATRVGENFFGIRICRISSEPPKGVKKTVDQSSKKQKTYVFIDRGRDKLEYLELGKRANTAGNYRRKLYRNFRRLRNTKLNLNKIKKVGGDHYRISRDFLDKLTQRLDIVASQAAIVPYFEKGKSAGFRIYRIRKNSLYQKLGIKNGDVIKRINGYEFTTPQKALEAYSNLMSANNLSVEVKRKGRMKNFRYEIK